MVAIIDYGVGNLASILNMHRRLGIDAVVTGDAAMIEEADRLLIPGVGHFDTCMQNFSRSGLRSLVERRAFDDNIPVLGICVGAQMMTRGSEEGSEKGLGWVEADTVRFRLDGLKVPHMGWREITITADNPLWAGLPPEPRFYFVHSYHFQFPQPSEVSATAHYGYDFTCAFRKGNIFGTQFHPEKSHKFGMKVLENFAAV
jgi:glutamine amidotransferase